MVIVIICDYDSDSNRHNLKCNSGYLIYIYIFDMIELYSVSIQPETS